MRLFTNGRLIFPFVIHPTPLLACGFLYLKVSVKLLSHFCILLQLFIYGFGKMYCDFRQLLLGNCEVLAMRFEHFIRQYSNKIQMILRLLNFDILVNGVRAFLIMGLVHKKCVLKRHKYISY